ncbi:hypothetical protein B0H13DRAFT_1887325 [Mycena leptocephala]|nr:hypothetical protein B0H13DRAFT_1887325 [Mycena leptocephala]
MLVAWRVKRRVSLIDELEGCEQELPDRQFAELSGNNFLVCPQPRGKDTNCEHVPGNRPEKIKAGQKAHFLPFLVNDMDGSKRWSTTVEHDRTRRRGEGGKRTDDNNINGCRTHS